MLSTLSPPNVCKSLGSPINVSFFNTKFAKLCVQKKLSFANKRVDMHGLACSEVDRCTLDRILNKLPSYQRGTFSAIPSGGFRSAKLFLKAGLVDDATCPFCCQCDEDISHIFLDCPACATIRTKFPVVDFTWLRQAPACTRLCAIP